MNTTGSVVAASVIVMAGRWAEDKKLDVKVMLGGTVVAYGLALLGEANEQLANQFGLLILIVAAFMYVPAIANKTGLSKTSVRWR